MKIIGMTITTETSSSQKVEQLLKLLMSMNISYVNIQDNSAQRPPVITKGNKKLDTRELLAFSEITREVLNRYGRAETSGKRGNF